MKEARELVHGTCVALGRRAALLRGKPGAGKSDLALRFTALPADGDLTPLHKHPRFQALIAGVKAKLAAAQADRTAESA